MTLYQCRFWGLLDLLGHTLGLARFEWFRSHLCDPYDDAVRRHWNGR